MSKVVQFFVSCLHHIYFISTFRGVSLSSFIDMDLSEYTDMKQLEKAIVRRIYITLYKKSRDARDKINQEWFDLNEILNSAFRDNERELVAKFMPRFKDFYSANNLLIDKDSVKLTQEGREMIKFYFLSR